MLRDGATGDWVGTFIGHKGAVWSCVLDAPALRAATASADFSARLWDAISGDELAQFPHAHIVRTAAFAPGGDALVTGGYEKVVRVWDLGGPGPGSAAAAEPRDAFTAPDKVRHAAYTADGGLLMTTYMDSPGVGIWDLRAGVPVASLPTAAVTTSLEVAADGRTFVTAAGTTAAVWDARALGSGPSSSFPFTFTVESASLAAAQGRLAVGGEDMWVHVLDLASGAEVDTCKGHHGPVHTVRFAPGGAAYASGSEDGTIRIWETEPAAGGAPPPGPAAGGAEPVAIAAA